MDKEINYLWKRICLGDERAFDALFEELYPGLCNFAFRILKNRPVSEEVVQDAFINLWQNKSEIILKGSLKSYLYQVVHNLSINRLEYFNTKKFRPNKVLNADIWKQIHSTYAVNDSFIQAFEAEETEQLILKAIDELPGQCREVFLLSRYENLNYQEIAIKLKISQNTVRVQIFRALTHLRDVLKKINH
jgi:RNA polymerase sigma-70 factor, ECF subfamily